MDKDEWMIGYWRLLSHNDQQPVTNNSALKLRDLTQR